MNQKDFKELKEDNREYEKCKASPLYFYNNYIRKDNEPVLDQEAFDLRLRLWESARGKRNTSKISARNPFNYFVEDYVPVEWRYKDKPISSAYTFPGVKILKYKPEDVIADVALYFGITVEKLKSKSRDRLYARPRQISAYFIKKKYPGLKLEDIGKMLGGFNHSTVINSLKVVQNDIRVSEIFKDMVKDIEKQIENHRVKKDSDVKSKKV